jgi:AcrR family transcriptional regulator
MKRAAASPALGRPRSFDTENALNAAMQVFWSKGYEGTSLTDLTAAMGINRPSLYAAFGDKEELFRKVLDRYNDGPAAYVRDALNQPTARRAIERLLQGTADMATGPGHPPGCLFVQGALACSEGARTIRNDLTLRRKAGQKTILQRLKRAQREGDLAASANPAELARYIVTVLHGIAVQAAGGATRNELRGVIQTALLAWPQ